MPTKPTPHKPDADRQKPPPRVLIENFRITKEERREIARAARRARTKRTAWERGVVLAEARRLNAA